MSSEAGFALLLALIVIVGALYSLLTQCAFNIYIEHYPQQPTRLKTFFHPAEQMDTELPVTGPRP